MSDVVDLGAFRRRREEEKRAAAEHCAIRIGSVGENVVTELEDLEVELLHTPESAEDFARALWRAASEARAARRERLKREQAAQSATAPDRTPDREEGSRFRLIAPSPWEDEPR